MTVDSQDLFAFPETNRFVSITKRRTTDDAPIEIWDVVIDGANTGYGFTQRLMDDLSYNCNDDAINDVVDAVTEKLSDAGVILSNTEKRNFKKLIRCLT